MDNYQATNTVRRYKAHVSIFGTTQLHLRNPYIIAWWSAAFPGLGHLLLCKYLRGFMLFLWEIFININAQINQAVVYSFSGQTARAIEVLEPRWMLLYFPLYFFGIWDSYRTTIDLNRSYNLAEYENATFSTFSISSLEINYLDKRHPAMSVLWSIFTPGAGQLHIHRIITGFFILIWTIVFIYFSHFLEAFHLLTVGEIGAATRVLNAQWLLFLPSLYSFAMYDAYINTVENNKLFDQEQRHFLKNNYQPTQFKMPSTKSTGE